MPLTSSLAALAFALMTIGSVARAQDSPTISIDEPSECTLTFDSEVVLRFAPRPAAGFSYPYYLLVPPTIKEHKGLHLLVETNNTGTTTDDYTRHDESAARLVRRSHASKIARELNAPLLVPVFPRPMSDWRSYIHALDDDTLRIDTPPLERVDLQLIAMIRDAQSVMQRNGLDVEDQVFMHGFSASGTFSNRFAIIHPEVVRAVASGGVNSIPTLPAKEWQGTTLPYPVGIADIDTLTLKEFDGDAYRRVSQFIYMGAHDRNDATLFSDSFQEEHAKLVHTLLGREMDVRWRRVQEAYEKLRIPAQMVTYDATGHTIRPEMLDDIVAFFRANSGPERRTIEPHRYPFVEFRELEKVHVNGVFWRGDERIPEFTRDLFDGSGTFVISIEEWLEGQDHQQLDTFRKKAGFHFQLRAPDQEPLEITKAHFLGTCSRGNGDFQGFVIRLDDAEAEKLTPGVEYTLVPIDTAARRWIVREDARLRR